jgi:hypothetical protein
LHLSAYLAECLEDFEFETLFTLSSAFYKSQFFSVPGHPTGLTCGVGTSKSFLGTKNFALCEVFSSHHASCTVPMSSAENVVQETHAEYHTLATRQDEYHLQESQGTEGFRVQERAAEQLAPQPVHPPDGPGEHQESTRNLEDQAS